MNIGFEHYLLILDTYCLIRMNICWKLAKIITQRLCSGSEVKILFMKNDKPFRHKYIQGLAAAIDNPFFISLLMRFTCCHKRFTVIPVFTLVHPMTTELRWPPTQPPNALFWSIRTQNASRVTAKLCTIHTYFR